MNILKKAFIGIFMFIFISSSVNALVLEGDITLVESTDNSLKISWDEVEGSIGYFVYYDTESHTEDKNYSNTSDDMIEGNNTVIEGLKDNTDYYVALKVADGEGNEGDFSKEFKFSTNKEVDTSSEQLIISNIDVVNNKTLSLDFNTEIDSNKEAEFKIVQKDDNLVESSIKLISINGSNVNLDLNEELENNKIYTLTVISLTGINGETIGAGVDGVIDFDSGDGIELNSATESGSQVEEGNVDESGSVIDDSDTELNSAGPETTTGSTLSGTNLSNDDIKKTAELAATKTKKLPQTGPTQWILLIFALILAFGITKFRKQA